MIEKLIFKIFSNIFVLKNYLSLIDYTFYIDDYSMKLRVFIHICSNFERPRRNELRIFLTCSDLKVSNMFKHLYDIFKVVVSILCVPCT